MMDTDEIQLMMSFERHHVIRLTDNEMIWNHTWWRYRAWKNLEYTSEGLHFYQTPCCTHQYIAWMNPRFVPNSLEVSYHEVIVEQRILLQYNANSFQTLAQWKRSRMMNSWDDSFTLQISSRQMTYEILYWSMTVLMPEMIAASWKRRRRYFMLFDNYDEGWKLPHTIRIF